MKVNTVPRELLHYSELPEYEEYLHNRRISRVTMLLTTVCLLIIVATSFYIGIQVERNGWLDNNKWLGKKVLQQDTKTTAPKFIKVKDLI